MKNVLLLIVMMTGLLLGNVCENKVLASVQTDETVVVQESMDVVPADQSVETEKQQTDSPWKYFLDNWGTWLLGIMGCAELIARITPTQKDNSIVNFLMSVFNALVPNLKKGGGSFNMLSK
jgi:hypothetical protein